MFPSFQRQVLGYDRLNANGALRVSLEVSSFVALQLSGGMGFFLASNDPETGMPRAMGRINEVKGGLRFMPAIWRSLAATLDANAGVGLMPSGVNNGSINRFAFDVGLGAHYEVASAFTIGPIVRYHHVVQDAASRPRPDAQFWSAGVDLVFRIPVAAEARPIEQQRQIERGSGISTDNSDEDNDGVLDSIDQCPSQPANGNNDRRRLGCPAFDADRDGVPDNIDQCREVPQGPSPHPTRSGCPDGDNDHDGVGNSGDQCVEEFQGFYANRQAPGCPGADRDRDLIPDAIDACADRPGSPNTNPDRAGCPGLVRLERDAIRVTEALSFEPDAPTLASRSERVVSALAEAIAAVTSIRRVVVVVPERLPGDREGGPSVAEARGRELVRRLVAEGIDAARLGTRPEPVAPPERGRRAPAPAIFLSITEVVSPPVR
jgi:hypothetical protein